MTGSCIVSLETEARIPRWDPFVYPREKRFPEVKYQFEINVQAVGEEVTRGGRADQRGSALQSTVSHT